MNLILAIILAPFILTAALVALAISVLLLALLLKIVFIIGGVVAVAMFFVIGIASILDMYDGQTKATGDSRVNRRV